MQTRYAVAADGTSLAYRVTGTGPALLAIGDWWGHIERDWDLPPLARVWGRLSRFSTLIGFDRRGTSLSDRLAPGQTPTLEEVVGDAVTVLDATETASAVVFVAASATPLGLALAALHPARVAGLVIYNGYGRFVQAPDQPFGVSPEALPIYRQVYEQQWGDEAMLRAVGPGIDWTPEVIEAATANMRYTASPRIARDLFPLLFESDLRHLATEVTVPTVVLHSRGSPIVPVEHGRMLAQVIPGARYVELPGDDHYFWGRDWAAICDEIEEVLTGRRGVRDIDRSLRTLLFSDIVRSTERALRLGDDEWARLLGRHEAAVQQVLDAFGGRRIKWTGDGVLATFDAPTRAVRGSIALQRAASHVGLQVRIGVHIGEVEVRGDDLGGIAVHVASRVLEAAAPAEIVVSRAVVEATLGSGITFESRGEHELRGVPDRWELFRVAPEVVLRHPMG